MNSQAIARVVSIAAGAAVLFGLRQYGVETWIAIAAGALVYGLVRAAFAFLPPKSQG